VRQVEEAGKQMQLVIKEKEEFLKQTEKDFSELQVRIVK